MDDNLLNWVKDGKYRVLVLKLLAGRKLLSSELASELKVNRASMSRILRHLKKKDLVYSITSQSRTVTYSITKKGEQVLEAMRND